MGKTIAMIVAAGIALVFLSVFFSVSSGVIGAHDGIEQECLDTYPVQAVSPSSETLILTHSVYLPLVGKTSPPLTETLKSKYVLVEHNTSVKYSEDCSLVALVSLPVYYYDSGSGILTIYPSGSELKLQTDDMGYVGRWIGGGGYYANYLNRFQTVPYEGNSLTLNAVSDDGTVSIDYMTTTITLPSNTDWVSQTVSYESDQPECVMTYTNHIINYAFQERDKIVYYNGVSQ